MNASPNTILRDYRIISKVGEGGMGSVYLAEDLNLERRVAIKVLNPLLTQDSKFTERFRQEARVQASLIHPNIVALHNFFQEEENYCMVMEYAEGITLKELIQRTGPLEEERAKGIFIQLLEAVGYAHTKGVVHRDIKPSNVIVGEGDSVKVMDFGIAKILGDKNLTKTGTKMGTLYYMSPEQIRAEKDIDQRTDIYSLGITFYEMLTGRIPFNTETESEFEIMNEIIYRQLPDVRSINNQISHSAAIVLETMIEKDKHLRPNTCYQCREMIQSSSARSGTKNPNEQLKTENTSGYDYSTLKKENGKSLAASEYYIVYCQECQNICRIRGNKQIEIAHCPNCKTNLMRTSEQNDRTSYYIVICCDCETKNRVLLNKDISLARCAGCSEKLLQDENRPLKPEEDYETSSRWKVDYEKPIVVKVRIVIGIILILSFFLSALNLFRC